MVSNNSESCKIFLDSHEFYHLAVQTIWNVIWGMDINTTIGYQIAYRKGTNLLLPSSPIIDIVDSQLSTILSAMCVSYHELINDEKEWINEKYNQDLDYLTYSIDILLLSINCELMEDAAEEIKDRLFRYFTETVIQYVLSTFGIQNDHTTIEAVITTHEYCLPILAYKPHLHGFLLTIDHSGILSFL